MRLALLLVSFFFLLNSCNNDELRIAYRLKYLEDSLKNEKRIIDSIAKKHIADSIAMEKENSLYNSSNLNTDSTENDNYESESNDKDVLYMDSDFQINKLANQAENNSYEIVIDENDNTFYLADTRHNESSNFNIEYKSTIYDNGIGQIHKVYKITNGWNGENRKLNKLVLTFFQNGILAENGKRYFKSVAISSDYNTLHDVSIVNAVFYCY